MSKVKCPEGTREVMSSIWDATSRRTHRKLARSDEAGAVGRGCGQRLWAEAVGRGCGQRLWAGGHSHQLITLATPLNEH